MFISQIVFVFSNCLIFCLFRHKSAGRYKSVLVTYRPTEAPATVEDRENGQENALGFLYTYIHTLDILVLTVFIRSRLSE